MRRTETGTGGSLSTAVASLANEAGDDTALAIRVHDFVRDKIRFGFTPWFDGADDSVTLRLGVGHCNPQARLFVGMLREAGLRARFRPVRIESSILAGLYLPVPRRLSHVFTEICLNDRWFRLDSYIVDPQLRRSAIKRLRAEGRRMGYGVHCAAQPDWDGASDCYSQIADAGQIVREYEPCDDIENFYRSDDYLHTVLGLRYSTLLSWARPVAGLLDPIVNARIDAIRNERS